MLNSLQYLRAIASLMVVFYHTTNPLRHVGYHGWWTMSFQNGVDIFFIVSGFLMLVTTDGRVGYAADFVKKRLVRIVPLYWIITTVFIAILAATPGALDAAKFTPMQAVTSYLFIPANNPMEKHIFPLVTPGWTLNCEMFFYALWAVVLLLPSRSRPMAATAALLTLAGLGFILPHRGVIAVFYTQTLLLEFTFGLGLAVWWLRGKPIPAWLGVAAILAGFVAMGFMPATATDRVLTWGLPATLVVGGALILEKAKVLPRIPALLFLGDASYSIYIVHSLILTALEKAWLRLPYTFPLDWLVFATLCIGLSVGIGSATYLFVEKPIMRLFSRRRVTAPVQPAVVTP